MRVTAKLIAAVATVLTGLMSANAVLRVRRETDIFLEDFGRDHRVLARTLSSTLQAIAAHDGVARAQTVLRATEHGAPDLHLHIMRPEETALGLRSAERALLARGREVSRHEGDEFVTWAPFRLSDQSLRVIEVRESTAGARAYVRQSAIRNAWLAAANVMGLALTIGVLGWWLIGIPTHKLAQKARRVGQGDLTGPLELPQRDELGDLARAMNAMCDELAQARATVSAKEEARVVALEQLRHADRLVTFGQIASSLAHELGTPLNVVLGRALLLTEDEPTRDEVAEHAGVIAAQTRRMARHIRKLLDFSRAASRRRAKVDLVSLAREAVDLLSPLAARGGVSLTLEAEAGAKLEATLDAEQIQQVLANLVVNAVHASRPRQRVRVEVGPGWVEATPPPGRHAAPGRFATLSVRDAGRGIEGAHLERIFEPFFTTKAEGEGTGLGLSVVDGIVREHRGWVEVTSAPGRGACFTVYLPERVDDDTMIETPSEAP